MRTEDETYLGAVGDHLVALGLPPDRVGQHLEEMAAHLEDSGRSGLDEYGSPRSVARELASADGLGIGPWFRPAATTAVAFLFGLGLVLLLGRGGGATLRGSQLGTLVLAAGAAGFLTSSAGAAHRDRLLGVTADEAKSAVPGLGVAIGLTVSAVSATIAIDVVVGDRVVGISSIRSWFAGLVIMAVACAGLWATRRQVIGRPRFRADSSLRSSEFTRRIRIDRGSKLTAAEVAAYGTPATVLGMIVAAGSLDDPWSTMALFLALVIGLTGLVLQRRPEARRSRRAEAEG